MTMAGDVLPSSIAASIVWRALAVFLARFRRFINRSVAAAIAHREHQASHWALRRLDHR
jgi:hypothetical protein